MRSTFRVASIFVLLLAINMLWQFPDVPMPLLHETTRLSWLGAWLQPWLFALIPLLRRLPERVYALLYWWRFFGASIPVAALCAATSLLIYYGVLRTLRLVPAFRRLGSRIPAGVLVATYALLACIYFGSCAYIAYARFPRVQDDDGNVITLPESERAQIRHIIAERADIHKPLYMMTLHDDGYGECYSVEYRTGDHYFVTSYDLVRARDGIWRLDKSTIRQVEGEPHE